MFRGRATRSARVRFGSSLALNNVALLFRLPLMWALVDFAGTSYLLANVATLLLLFAARFAVTDRIVYRVER